MSEPDDNELLRRQLRELEARVARLEAERDGALPPEREAAPPPPKPQTSAADVARELAESRAAEPAAWPVSPPPIREAVAGRVTGEAQAAATTEATTEQEASGRPRAREGKEDLERFFALSVLGRVGIAAIVLAAAYFGQLGWKNLDPTARMLLVYAFGGVLVGAGALLRRIVDPRYVALLWGGGVAVTYVAGVLAHLRYHVVSSSFAMVSLLLTAALGQWLARNLRLQIMATIALAGAYTAPVIVGTPSPTPTAFFVLLLSLHGWAAWIEHRWQWRQARLLAVAATVVLVWAWYSKNGIVGPVSFFWHVEVVWLLLALPELIRAWLRQPIERGRVWAVFVLGLVAHLAATMQRHLMPGTGLIVGLLLLLAGGAYVPRTPFLGRSLARIPAVLLPVATLLWLHDALSMRFFEDGLWVLLLSFAGVAALQLGARAWTQVGELGAGIAAGGGLFLAWINVGSDAALTLAQGPLLLLTPVMILLFARPPMCRVFGFLLGVAGCLLGVLGADQPPIEGYELVAVALVAATTMATFGTWLAGHRSEPSLARAATAVHGVLLLAWLGYCVNQTAAASAEPLTAVWNVRFAAVLALVALVAFARSLLDTAEVEQRAVLGVVILVTSYVGGLLELLDFIHGWTFGPHAAATSIYTLAFATALLLAGGWRRIVALRWSALVLFGGVAVKVAAYDLSDAKTPIRVLVTGVLGAVLLLVAWGYARQKRR